MDLYGQLAKKWSEKVHRESKKAATKADRPLKMPKDYDFSVRDVNWADYKHDFILRTDAVWEKSKLKDHFYTLYKNHVFSPADNRYYVSNLRVVPNPSIYADHILDLEPWQGYSDVDGCIWAIKPGPVLYKTPAFSHFVCDKEGDAWYSCFIGFQKFMKCNERSEVPIEEARLFNNGYFDYPCYEHLGSLFYSCGPDLFEIMFELYRMRIMGTTDKAPNYTRLQLFKDPMNTTSDRKVRHY